MLEETSKKFTGFTCPVGTFEHSRVPMGLKCAPAYYQRCVQRILEPLLYVYILQYIDDTLIYAESEEGLLDCLEQYFELLAKANVKLHPGKFTLFAKEVIWGGKMISEEDTKPKPRRVTAVQEMT